MMELISSEIERVVKQTGSDELDREGVRTVLKVFFLFTYVISVETP